MDSFSGVRNKMMYVLLLRTVSVLTRVLFWCLFPELRNIHQNNSFMSAETVRHSSTYIILYTNYLTMPLTQCWCNVPRKFWPLVMHGDVASLGRIWSKFNSLAPERCGSNFRIWFSNSSYRIVTWALAVKLLWCECQRMSFWWAVSIGSGNGLVPPGNKPLPQPMWIQIFVAIWHH